MVGIRALALGRQTVAQRPRLLLTAWLLHAVFASLAVAPAVGVFTGSIENRPQFSNQLLHDFSLDLLVSWRAAYGQPLRNLVTLAVILTLLYAAAKIALDCFIFPAYLAPFEDFRDGRLARAAARIAPRVVGASLASVGFSLVVAGLTLSFRGQTSAAIAFVVLAGFLRVLGNLWKCGGFGEAWTAVRQRPGTTLWLTLTTLLGIALYAVAAGALVWFDFGSAHPFAMFFAQQVLVFAGVWMRLWLAASAVVLWRSCALQSGHV